MDKDMILASIMGFTVGDALGVPVEFKSRRELELKPVVDMQEHGTHNQPIGTWSDDTSMVLATIDSIIRINGIDYKDIMSNYLKWYKNAEFTANNQLFDIGISTRRALERFSNGAKAVKCGSSDYNSNGNGSLMRVLPIALYSYYNDFTEQQLVETIYYFSSLTHAHDISLMGCKIYVDFIHQLLDREDPKDAYANIIKKDYSQYYDDYSSYKRLLDGSLLSLPVNEVRSTGFVVDSLEAAIWCTINSSSYREAVLKAVNLGEDTDTVAALTGALNGIIYGSSDIPQEWIDKIKNRDYIVSLISSFSDRILPQHEQLGIDYEVSQLEHDNANYEFWEKVRNADMSLFDINFVNFFRKGTIMINGNEYSLEDLYILNGTINDENKTILVHYKNPVFDLITNQKYADFYQTDLMLFKCSGSFYYIYSLYKDRIKNNTLEIDGDMLESVMRMINEYNGSQHDKTPETYFQLHR